ncbi:MAG: quinone oxidoreductase, partial [Pseudolabrys sp.]|nr:quinone oxidoreductase [Pseudolabrys sp.]
MVAAVRVHKTGGPEVLQLADFSEPKPGPGEALVRHVASGVNFIDCYLR